MSQAREFAVTPPDLRLPGLVVVIVLIICLGSLSLGWRALQGAPALWLVLATVLIAPAVLLVSLFRRKVLLDGEHLRVIAGLNQTRVPLAMLLPQQARIVDVDSSPENRLGMKTFGTAMPGYYAGHFRQIGGSKVFALVTGKRRVLVLPGRDGRLLMLSLEKPQALLDAIAHATR